MWSLEMPAQFEALLVSVLAALVIAAILYSIVYRQPQPDPKFRMLVTLEEDMPHEAEEDHAAEVRLSSH